MTRIFILIAACCGALALIGGAAANDPPGRDPCSHGATGKECRPDPQPGHGEDCDRHGNNGGVNEDHCNGEAAPSPCLHDCHPTPPPPPCLHDCHPAPPPPPPGPPPPPPANPSAPSAPPTVTTPAPPTTTPATPAAAAAASMVQTTSTAKPPKQPVKPKATPKLTGNPKVDKCHEVKGGVLNCKGIIVVPGSG